MRAEPCPATGGGVHVWLLSEANRCRYQGLTPDQTAQHLRAATAGCGRPVPPREIVGAVGTAWRGQLSPGQRFTVSPAQSTWPEADEKRIAELARDGRGLCDLWEASPMRLESNASQAEALVDALFPGNPLLCVAKAHPADAQTKPREEWRGTLAQCALIVPSPMSAPTGQTLDGRESVRCLGNTAARRFLIVEFDSGGLDGQAARIFHLASKAPLALVAHSGSKSLHSWFYCQGQADESLRRFMRYAVTLGADRATWNKSQLVRLPDGRRDDGRPQRPYYFNPAVIKA